MSRKITKDDVQKKLNTFSIDEILGMFTKIWIIIEIEDNN